MRIPCRWLVSAFALCVAAPYAVADEEDRSAFDRIWSHATLYENESNRYVQKFSLSGRLQADSAWFDADQGQYDDAFIWRRFRFGFKTQIFQNWVVHIEGDFDLNESLGDSYSRLTDANVAWSPSQNLHVKVLKQSVGFTLDGATSSAKLLTMQRNNLTNNIWSTDEYFTGLNAGGKIGRQFTYNAGVFSSDGSDGLSHFDAGYFARLSLGYRLAGLPTSSSGLIRIDYVYNDADVNAATSEFSQVLSLVTKWKLDAWGLRTDLSAGQGYAGQSDIWGAVLMPFYDFSSRIQTVVRYTYVSSADDNGVELPRYEDRIVSGRGDDYDEIYAGVNIYFYGHKLKWQTGLEYASMKDNAGDGGAYEGWGLSTGLRMYW